MTPTIDEQLKQAKELAKAATPGPWRDDDGDICAKDDEGCPRGYDARNIIATSRAAADRNFIAESRTLLPALVAECERLKELWDAKSTDLAAHAAEEAGRAWKDVIFGLETKIRVLTHAERLAKDELSRLTAAAPEWRAISALDNIHQGWSRWAVRGPNLAVVMTSYPRMIPGATEVRPVDSEGVPVPWASVGL